MGSSNKIKNSNLDQHIEAIAGMSGWTNNSITIYDNFKRAHVWMSPNHKELFGCNEYADIQIHPDDFEAVMRNGITCMRHFFIGNKNGANQKLVREYRININGVFRRVTEQIQILETDCKGNIWLTFSMMDISPNQSPPYRVNSKLINFRTGDFISPVDTFFNSKSILSDREISMPHSGCLTVKRTRVSGCGTLARMGETHSPVCVWHTRSSASHTPKLLIFQYCPTAFHLETK